MTYGAVVDVEIKSKGGCFAWDAWELMCFIFILKLFMVRICEHFMKKKRKFSHNCSK